VAKSGEGVRSEEELQNCRKGNRRAGEQRIGKHRPCTCYVWFKSGVQAYINNDNNNNGILSCRPTRDI